MSSRVTPKVFLVADTRPQIEQLNAYLAEIGAIDKALNYSSHLEIESFNLSDQHSQLIEFLGRLCYRSFVVGLNKNVTKIRNDNKDYLDNILKVKHGSILEHCSVTFILHNVSRVLTHEIVRHRAGTAFSQESLRYVRLDDMGFYLPELVDLGLDAAENLDEMGSVVYNIFRDAFNYISREIGFLEQYLSIDKYKSFDVKKKITSMLRRLAPMGMTTGIAITANHRALRNIIEQRCSIHAEQEIREVCFIMAAMLKERYPNIYQDLELDTASKTAKFKYEKV